MTAAATEALMQQTEKRVQQVVAHHLLAQVPDLF